MEVQLIHYTPLHVVDRAVGKCWDTGCKATSEERDARLKRVILKHKHGSIAEHINYTFDIDGISRACLQELARHRHASLSVKSTRYTIKELVNSDKPLKDFLVSINPEVDLRNLEALRALKMSVMNGMSNDIAKYMLSEAYKTSLVWTINLRSLQNFFLLRTSKAALPEIRELAYEIAMQIPKEHQYLIEESLI